MTMKMISSTSITSTIGVTLMSETGFCACFFLNMIFIDFLHGTRQVAGGGGQASPRNQLAGFRQTRL
jgi:hypothetical protein